MAELSGNATPEEADKELLKEVRGRLASATSSNPVTLTQAQAMRLYEMAGGSMEVEEEEPQDPKEKLHVGAPGQYPEPHAGPTPAQREAAQAGVGIPTTGSVETLPPGAAANVPAGQQASGAAGAQSSSGGKPSRAQLNEMTKEELVAYADDHDIDVTPSWTKADIVDAIAKHKG